MATSQPDHIRLAEEQLAKVQAAWDPPDWSDLTLYGFYWLENSVLAAASHAGLTVQRTHSAKVAAATQLAQNQGLPDISNLPVNLNTARKATAYGDTPMPDLNLTAEDLAREIEDYVQSVKSFISA